MSASAVALRVVVALAATNICTGYMFQKSPMCFAPSNSMIGNGARGLMISHPYQSRQLTATRIRMDHAEGVSVRSVCKKQWRNIIGIVGAGIGAFFAPGSANAAPASAQQAPSHYQSNEPLIVLPSQEAYARRMNILNDKDYQHPVVKIVKDRRLWAGVGACTIGAGGYVLYQNAEKKKSD